MPQIFDPPHFADPKQDPWMTQILMAGLQSGHAGTFELACILSGRKDLIPCPGCDFVPAGCRCGNASMNEEAV